MPWKGEQKCRKIEKEADTTYQSPVIKKIYEG
jgi:hypothetical protein